MKRTKSIFSVWTRLAAFGTFVFFTSTNIVQADMIHTITSKSAPAQDASAYIKNSVQQILDSISLPENAGQVKHSFQGTRDKIVIHIQDAHVNEDAQRNIAKIIDYLAKNHGLKLVNVEGAEGDLYTKLFTFFPYPKVRKDVAEYFLKEGRLSASEYSVIGEHPELKLFGIENDALYQENRKAYLNALGFKGRDEAVLKQLDKILKDASRFVFSDKMRELLRRRAGFQEEGRELVAYVGYLVDTAKEENIAVHDYPRVHSLLELVALEKQIDFEKAEKEVNTLTDDFKNILSKERLSRFLENSVQFQMKKMRRSAYYGYLENEISAGDSAADLKSKYQNVLNYLRYTRLYDAIDVQVFDEIHKLESAVKNKLFRTPEEVKLDQLLRIQEVYGKIFDFSLAKQDVDFFYQYLNDFKSSTYKEFLKPIFQKYRFSYDLPKEIEVLDEDLPKVEKFYQAALQRDPVLIQNAVEKMEKEGEKISVIVTGGFHTPGIEEYLREHDYSYLVITPKISSKLDPGKENIRYQEAMTHKPLPIEKTLSDAFFAPKSTKVNDPSFQLAVPLVIQTTLEGSLSGETAKAIFQFDVIGAMAEDKNTEKVRTAFSSGIAAAGFPPEDAEKVQNYASSLLQDAMVEVSGTGVYVYQPIPGTENVQVTETNPTDNVRPDLKRNGSSTLEIGSQYWTTGAIPSASLPAQVSLAAALRSETRTAAPNQNLTAIFREWIISDEENIALSAIPSLEGKNSQGRRDVIANLRAGADFKQLLNLIAQMNQKLAQPATNNQEKALLTLMVSDLLAAQRDDVGSAIEKQLQVLRGLDSKDEGTKKIAGELGRKIEANQNFFAAVNKTIAKRPDLKPVLEKNIRFIQSLDGFNGRLQKMRPQEKAAEAKPALAVPSAVKKVPAKEPVKAAAAQKIEAPKKEVPAGPSLLARAAGAAAKSASYIYRGIAAAGRGSVTAVFAAVMVGFAGIVGLGFIVSSLITANIEGAVELIRDIYLGFTSSNERKKAPKRTTAL